MICQSGSRSSLLKTPYTLSVYTYGRWLYWLLRASVQNQARRGGERATFPACKHRRVGVQSEVVDSMLMLERGYSYMMEQLLVWRVF